MDVSNEMAEAKAQSMYKCLCDTARRKPSEPAVIEIDSTGGEKRISWSELCAKVNDMAAYLGSKGVEEKSRVVIAMPNGIPTVVTTLAVWRLGACSFVLSQELVPSERKVLLDQVEPELVVSSWKDVTKYQSISINDSVLAELPRCDKELPDYISNPGKATATGGSTGIPKIIIEEADLVFGENDFQQWMYITGLKKDDVQLVCGSLHHSLFNNTFFLAMAMGNTNVLMKRFDEERFVKLVDKYKVNNIVLVPTMMSRVIRAKAMETADWSTVTSMHHAGAACPIWLKKDWIEKLGGEKVHEFYSMSEKVGMTHIRGDEYLTHVGSVGRPLGAVIDIFDDEMNPVPQGTIGNVYFTSDAPRTTHYFLESQRLNSIGNSVSVGDLGYLDGDGYLYLVDRRSDMIISGGKNIYAAEVENALREYPKVRDIVVIGLSDPTWGRSVHALIEPDCAVEDFDLYDFANFGFKKISNYKLPKTVELMEKLPRDESGKIRRKNLVDPREEDRKAFAFKKVPDGHQLIAWRNKKKKQQQ